MVARPGDPPRRRGADCAGRTAKRGAVAVDASDRALPAPAGQVQQLPPRVGSKKPASTQEAAGTLCTREALKSQLCTAILYSAWHTGLSSMEMTRLRICDFLTPERSIHQATIAVSHGSDRNLDWSDERVKSAIDSYLTQRAVASRRRRTDRIAALIRTPDCSLNLRVKREQTAAGAARGSRHVWI
jgi:hypothetical protein